MTKQDNTMNTIDELLWYIERGYLIDEVKTNSDIRKQAKQVLLTLIASEKRELLERLESATDSGTFLTEAIEAERAALQSKHQEGK